MTQTRRRSIVRALALLLAAGAMAVGGAGCARDGLEREAMMDPAACATCHPRQHEEWAGSMHAYSADDPVFIALVRFGQRTTGGALGSLCVGCHAPAALATGATTDGTNLDQVPRGLRGVGCWACHSIDGVTALHNGGLTRADDSIARGGIGDPVETGAHGSLRTPYLSGDRMESSEACGACHDVQVGDVAVESSYAEWAGSLFGPGGAVPVSCATCHMFGRTGPAADLPGMPERRLHDHGFPGIDQALIPWPGGAAQAAGIARDLASSLSSKLCVIPGAGGAEIQVTLDNLQVGHAFPSGVTHARRVWVEVRATAGEQVLFESGRFAPGEVVSVASDPRLWLLSSTLRGADGGKVETAWEAKGIDRQFLAPSVTADPQDPRFYHAQTRTYPVTGVPDRVDITIHVESIGLELLDGLIASGDLDPAVRAKVPRRTIPTLSRTWLHASGFGCAP